VTAGLVFAVCLFCSVFIAGCDNDEGTIVEVNMYDLIYGTETTVTATVDNNVQ
jgi:hypothetical protein